MLTGSLAGVNRNIRDISLVTSADMRQMEEDLACRRRKVQHNQRAVPCGYDIGSEALPPLYSTVQEGTVPWPPQA